MNLTNGPLTYAYANRSRFVAELKDFVRFPTVSAQPKHTEDLKKCAAWLADHLRKIGLEQVKIIPTGGHPAIYAERHHEPGQPTLLIYGHYDVQPAEPLNEWRLPPFQPAIQNNYIHGRGASDDKGQLFCHVKAIEAYLKTSGTLPINVKCLFEGEEEIGSPNLSSVISQNASQLASNVAVISDFTMLGPNRPTIIYGLRGALASEIEISGPSRDLHSGHYGGAVHNPLQVLCEIISKLHDTNGQVTIPGFYNRVRPVSATGRAALSRSGKSGEQILRETGAAIGWGEQDFSLFERTTIRPALTINGIIGGYSGTGSKAVIPSKAVAKISIRLVPDQDPGEVDRLLSQYIARLTPPTVRSKVSTLLRAKPALLPIRHPAIRAASRACHQAFGTLPALTRSGGTIPPVSMFQEILNISSVLMGFGLPGDNIHAPNERFYLPNFYRGIATSIHLLAEIGAMRDLGIGRSPRLPKRIEMKRMMLV